MRGKGKGLWFRFKFWLLRWLLRDVRFYYITTALRGPDLANRLGRFKTILTARLRHWCGFNDKRAGPSVRSVHEVSPRTLHRAADLLASLTAEETVVRLLERESISSALSHLGGHMYQAFHRIKPRPEDADEHAVLIKLSDHLNFREWAKAETLLRSVEARAENPETADTLWNVSL